MYHSYLLGITLDYSRHWLLVLREISVEAYDVLGDSQQRKAYDAELADFHRRPETSQGRQAGMRSQKGGGEVEKKGGLLNHIYFKQKKGDFFFLGREVLSFVFLTGVCGRQWRYLTHGADMRSL